MKHIVNLKEWRESGGLTLEQAAKATGLSIRAWKYRENKGLISHAFWKKMNIAMNRIAARNY